NNKIQKAVLGIQAVGVATTGVLDNLTIEGNDFGDANAANGIGRFAILVGQATGANVNRNTITNVVTSDPAVSATNNARGILIDVGTVNSNVTRNTITGVRYTSTAGYGGKGVNNN